MLELGVEVHVSPVEAEALGPVEPGVTGERETAPHNPRGSRGGGSRPPRGLASAASRPSAARNSRETTQGSRRGSRDEGAGNTAERFSDAAYCPVSHRCDHFFGPSLCELWWLLSRCGSRAASFLCSAGGEVRQCRWVSRFVAIIFSSRPLC